VKYNPFKAALQQVALVFLLSVTLSDVQLFASFATNLESVAFILSLCSFYKILYINTNLETLGSLEEAVMHLYTELLIGTK